MSSSTTTTIANLYKLIENMQKHKCDKKICCQSDSLHSKFVQRGVDLCKTLSDEEIMLNQKTEHPIFHEMMAQWIYTRCLIKEIKKIKKLEQYWDNSSYVDQYKYTLVERLAVATAPLLDDKERKSWFDSDVKWMGVWLNIKPTYKHPRQDISDVDYRVKIIELDEESMIMSEEYDKFTKDCK